MLVVCVSRFLRLTILLVVCVSHVSQANYTACCVSHASQALTVCVSCMLLCFLDNGVSCSSHYICVCFVFLVFSCFSCVLCVSSQNYQLTLH